MCAKNGNDKYFGSIVDDLVIKCDEIRETTKTVRTKTVPAKAILTNFNEKKFSVKRKFFCFTCLFLLISISLSISVTIYCCFIKHQLY